MAHNSCSAMINPPSYYLHLYSCSLLMIFMVYVARMAPQGLFCYDPPSSSANQMPWSSRGLHMRENWQNWKRSWILPVVPPQLHHLRNLNHHQCRPRKLSYVWWVAWFSHASSPHAHTLTHTHT